ncbi:ABC transporter ATP-binding protein [Paenibacillus mendelii]|uniref:Spermidine/putrescine import ATP-binding protein PotA n=1 Tax=Paenibacillus mendelii TaxID=206163 RepID=A0ABV6J890_9BACL|nr:ABC transporter ATP-binding protein [Paenibacillus mendelii]MCQ6561286.1 ABC transporter ATP-binding protein [Paenibacillus mendelii]
MSNITIQQVSREFGANTALKQVNLEVREGEFFSLLGPSGCGKTTLLNIIAGFLEPTTGEVLIGGREVTDLPPYRRDIGMVFQNYALFPHLSVFENVAYGLKVRKMPRADIRKRVEESLASVRLESFAARMPHQLSGGQQQRVAIARALAIKPKVLLLDEPLSNLDAKLRKEMQSELRSLQQSVGITTVLVTHDQEEALSLSDRIGILGNGELQQLGSPLDVYRRPANRFVAEFIGQVNLIEAKAVSASGSPAGVLTYQTAQYRLASGQPLSLSAASDPALTGKESVLFMLRPERIQLSPEHASEGTNQTEIQITDVSYAGNFLRIAGTLPGGGELVIQAPDPSFTVLPEPGQTLYARWAPEDLVPLV